MTDVALAVKVCPTCGERKPLSGFYRNRSKADGRARECKECAKARVKASNEALRERMGDDYFRAHKAEIVRRHRAAGRDARSEEGRRAYDATLRELRRRHQAEFDALLVLERRARGLD